MYDLIGQFGVGFYSAFMVSDWIRVNSRSFRPDAQAAEWFSTGIIPSTVVPGERTQRGTSVTLKLKEDSREFLEEYRLREIVRRHSDFIPFPIYVIPTPSKVKPAEEVVDETAPGEDVGPAPSELKQVNRQTALWRQQPREVEQKAYEEFYQQFTYDFEAPLIHAHMVVDAPVQMYALLFIPPTASAAFTRCARSPV